VNAESVASCKFFLRKQTQALDRKAPTSAR